MLTTSIGWEDLAPGTGIRVWHDLLLAATRLAGRRDVEAMHTTMLADYLRSLCCP